MCTKMRARVRAALNDVESSSSDTSTSARASSQRSSFTYVVARVVAVAIILNNNHCPSSAPCTQLGHRVPPHRYIDAGPPDQIAIRLAGDRPLPLATCSRLRHPSATVLTLPSPASPLPSAILSPLLSSSAFYSLHRQSHSPLLGSRTSMATLQTTAAAQQSISHSNVHVLAQCVP
ncbi:hypothetical protein NUW54_g7264 [Trametes sanguinea]|uniref:Uncharacterized protein n=1 Tax=Trametes sanguinea TaxID=158606 RepID=A0ACC1PQD4_9APHY|nr:hypothetical protein NUW54_g7264 [Trametes sanguinea]